MATTRSWPENVKIHRSANQKLMRAGRPPKSWLLRPALSHEKVMFAASFLSVRPRANKLPREKMMLAASFLSVRPSARDPHTQENDVLSIIFKRAPQWPSQLPHKKMMSAA